MNGFHEIPDTVKLLWKDLHRVVAWAISSDVGSTTTRDTRLLANPGLAWWCTGSE